MNWDRLVTRILPWLSALTPRPRAARARIVERPEEYAWSSCQDYLGMRKAPEWLDWETVVAGLAKELSSARSAYRRLVEAGLREPPKSPLAAAVGRHVPRQRRMG